MSGDAGTDGPVLHLTLLGNLGNQMIEYMVALKLVSLVPGCRISNVQIPQWNIEHPAIESAGPVVQVGPWERIDLPMLAAALNAGAIRRVEWAGYGQRMENFLPHEIYDQVFVTKEVQEGYASEHLVCPVRAGDIVDGTYGDYPLTPVEFYAQLIDRTGLQPVFMGQTTPNAYTDRLRERFPDAPFLDSRGPMGDFELIRRSKNIVVGVSTFSWLAAWLSHAERIFMTVSGLFNPIQGKSVDLLPFGDSRYRFWLFPINYALPLAWHAFWYAGRYPMAALEVAQGDYADLHHHYVAIGKARGYRPVPG